jgi:hypothetical protein
MNTLLVFAKEPQQAKQRLRETLPGALVTRLASAFLRDTLATVATLDDVVVRLAFSPKSAEPKFSGYMQEFSLLPPHGLMRQRGRALGMRLELAFREAFDNGAARVIAIGSDSPCLSAKSIEAGFRVLEEHDCVLGPTLDGGYYLVGLSRPYHELFRGVDWQCSDVYKTTIDTIERDGVTYRELPLFYDVDTPEDLEYVVRDINQFRLEGDEESARHSETVLAKILEVER